VRFVIPGVLLMSIPMVAILNRRTLVIPVVAIGFAIQLLGVLVGPLDFVLLLRSQQFQREALYVGGSNRVDFEDMRFNPSYSQILGNWYLLRDLLHLPPAPEDPGDETTLGTNLYDAIPPQAWASAAAWDFAWNRSRFKKPTSLSVKAVVSATSMP
jgi:hypothetical protein